MTRITNQGFVSNISRPALRHVGVASKAGIRGMAHVLELLNHDSDVHACTRMLDRVRDMFGTLKSLDCIHAGLYLSCG